MKTLRGSMTLYGAEVNYTVRCGEVPRVSGRREDIQPGTPDEVEIDSVIVADTDITDFLDELGALGAVKERVMDLREED